MVELYRVEGSLAFLSLVGSFLIILSAMFVKELRQHPTNLVLLLSICDFMFALKFAITSILPNSISYQDITAYCIGQAVWAQFWGMASISWNGIISLNLMANLRKPFLDTSKWGTYYHLWVWVLSGVTTILLVVLNMYGVSGDGTCWIKGDYNLFRLVFFIPLLAYFVLGASAFMIGLSSTRSLSEESSVRTRMVFRMFFYTSVFIICWSGPLAHRFTQYWRVYSDVFIYADAIGQSVQGFANALVWLTNPSFFGSFKKNILMRVPVLRSYYFKLDDTNLPLLRDLGVHEYLHDDRQDMQKLDIVIRKNIITFLLYGMKEACEDVQSRYEEPLNEADFREVRDILELKYENTRTMKEYRFVDYCPYVFQKLRAQAGITPEAYMASIQPELFLKSLSNQKFSEGRSGSFFCFSPDKCFIIKTIPESEAKLLNKILPAYYQYIGNNPDSRLMRFYGLHAIKMHYGDQVFVIVMSNAFRTHRKIHERYDLKGSWVRREVGKDFRDNPGKVLGMDIDLKAMGRKVRLTNEQRTAMVQQITDDATFMCSLGIMDYSILLGIHFVDRAAEGTTVAIEGVAASGAADATDGGAGASSTPQTPQRLLKNGDESESESEGEGDDRRPLLDGGRRAEDLEAGPSTVESTLDGVLSLERENYIPLHIRPSVSEIEKQRRNQKKMDKKKMKKSGRSRRRRERGSTTNNASHSSPPLPSSDHSINLAASSPEDYVDDAEQDKSGSHTPLRARRTSDDDEVKKEKKKKEKIEDAYADESDYSTDSYDSEDEFSDDVEGRLFRDEGFLSVDGKEIYYLCIIDILQLYDLNKKAERFWKVRVMHKDFHGVSVQPPPRYRDRFVACAFDLVTSPDATAS